MSNSHTGKYSNTAHFETEVTELEPSEIVRSFTCSKNIFNLQLNKKNDYLEGALFSVHCLPHVSVLFYCAAHSPQGIMSMRRSDSKAGFALWSLCQKGTSSLHWTTATGNRKFSTLPFLSHCVCLTLQPLKLKVCNWVVAEDFH